MGIFSRLNAVLRSNLNSLADRAEDPAKLIAQTVRDMEGELRSARRELVTAKGTAKRLANEREELEAEAQGWEDKAVLALQQNDEALAREALRHKNRARRQADETATRAARQAAAADEMKATLERVEQRIEDLRARGSTLAADVRRARQASPAEPEVRSRYGSETFDELERMGGRIDQLEAEVEVSETLDEARKPDTDRRFRELEQEAEADAVEDELSTLKRKLDGGR
ncbi:MAG: PspA/IM30 family protein [Myxococcota bacterium]